MTAYEVRVTDLRADYFERLGAHMRELPPVERDNAWADHYARVRRGEAAQKRVRPTLTLARLLSLGPPPSRVLRFRRQA